MFKHFRVKHTDFYDKFDEHAATCLKAIQQMQEAMRNIQTCPACFQSVQQLEHRCDEIAHEVIDLLRTTFITPFDRDEIQLLISRMDDIADFTEAATHRLVLFEIDHVPEPMLKLGDVLFKAHQDVVQVISLLRTVRESTHLNDLCKNINTLENMGDMLHHQGIAELFRVYKNDPLMVIKLKAIYEILEEAVDSCEDVAEIAVGIALEHS